MSPGHARRLWLRAQRLDEPAPFGEGAAATPRAVAHLGYVQIDTIHVIERCHHHILWSRIPDYSRAHLSQAQSLDKSVFEYWTHALAYLPSADFRFALPDMKRYDTVPRGWNASVKPEDVRKVLTRIRRDGPLTIRDIDDDVLTQKEHLWASRKPSKRALQYLFYTGALTISARSGMLKTYELTSRHFGWDRTPRPASDGQVLDYLLDRALRAQGIVSLDSICHLDAARKPAVRERIEARLRARKLKPVAIDGIERIAHWATPEALAESLPPLPDTAHILSPFDPLIIQRKRLNALFDYAHLFEAYVPKEKRVLGYFALPVLIGDEIVAAIDLKAERARKDLTIQKWTWTDKGDAARHNAPIEEALHRFAAFQFGE